MDDVLVHLCNEDVYKRLTEEEAILHEDVLRTDILDWLEKYRRIIGKHAFKFISDHIKNNLESPFGQFYVLYTRFTRVKWPMANGPHVQCPRT